MNMLSALLKILRGTGLLAGLTLISTAVFAGPVYDLDPNTGRYMFFDDYSLTADGTPPTWQHFGTLPPYVPQTKGLLAGTNHVHRSGWSFMNCRMGRTLFGTSVPPDFNGNLFAPNGTNYCLYVQNTTAATIQSPVFSEGAGTLYLDAISVYTDSPELSIYIATNMVNQFGQLVPIDASAQTNRQNIIWEPEGIPAPIETITLPSGDSYTPFKREINIRQPVCIKIERSNAIGTTRDNYYAAIDNIRVSPPPSDVVISKEFIPFDAYPCVNKEMNLQFRIDNAPGPYTSLWSSRSVQLVSRWNYLHQVTTPWVTNQMYCVNTGDGAGNGELWQSQNPMPAYPDAGVIEYFFLCSFAGTYYQSYNYTVYPKVLDPLLFPPEKKSPRVYDISGMTLYSAIPFGIWLRLFPSAHSSVTTKLFVNGSPTPIALPMTHTGTNTWQAKYDLVNHPEATNLLWYFEATGAYTNTFARTLATNFWQNTSLTRIQNGTLPYGDNCGQTDATITNRPQDWFGVKVTPGESSYVLFTLDTAKTNYLVGRGEYQNFNAWNTGATAQNYFTDVDDKYPKVSYPQSFLNGWQASYFTGMSNWFMTDLAYTVAETEAVRVGPEGIINEWAWNAGSFQYAVERTAGNTQPDYSGTASQRRNQAVRLFGGSQPLGLGYYQGNRNQQNGITGVGTITFKARLSRPIATDPDYNFNVAWRKTDMQRTNYVISTTMRAISMSPEKPSMSLIAYYQDMYRFYEYRITQEYDSRDLGNGNAVNLNWDKRLRHEIWKWDGTRTPKLLAKMVRTQNTADGLWDNKLTDGTTFNSYPTEMHVYNPSTSETHIKVKLRQTIITGWKDAADQAIAGDVIVDASDPIKFGSYGFHSADCTLWVPNMWIKNLDPFGNEFLVVPVSVIDTPSEWYLAPGFYKTTTPGFISEAISTGIQVLTGTSELGPWTPFTTKTVNSYAYQSFTATTNAWNNLCAKIQANGGTSVAIDGIHVQSWRGETIMATPSDGWKITEGWLNYNGLDQWFAHLDAAQADPSLIQGVRSKQIVGIGSLSFDYRVTAAPAQLKIQYTSNTFPQDESEFGWEDITNLTFNATTGWTSANYFLALAPATNLYVRIINNLGTNPQAKVDVRNIVIWNNPTNSPNDWSAYNMKITDTETDKWFLDKGEVDSTPSSDKARSGYMNNSTSANIYPGRPMNDYNPSIMAPRLTRGLGTLSFFARAFTENYAAGDTNTAIAVYATTDPWNKYKPDAFWTKLHTFRNITNAFYRPFFFSYPVAPNEIQAIKLVVEGPVYPAGAPAPQRVCIDEIVVTEAIYPRFDITGVKLLLPGTPDPKVTQQPLEGEDVGVEAQLTNVLLDPQDIQVWITYVLGTNTWGVFNAPPAKQITKPMSLVDPVERIYRTTGDFMNSGIPDQDKYSVVQYLVWAQYYGNGFHTIYQSTNTAERFTNPSWYFPVDLNKQNHKVTGVQKPTWTPYYIVYDVPPGSVWINELNLNENSLAIEPKVFMNPYIEIAQPSWMDLSGWRMEILNQYHDVRLAWQLVSPGSIQPALGAQGYGLFVIGPYDFEATTAIPPYPPLSSTTTVHQAIQNIRGDFGASLYPGGYRLIRPMGMYEQAIAYDWDRQTVSWDTIDMFLDREPTPKTPFRYVGREHYNGSLSFTGTVDTASGNFARADNTNTWQQGLTTFNWTPGRINVGQAFPNTPIYPDNWLTNVLFITPNTKVVTYDGGLSTLFIGSTTNWTVTASEAWITPYITSGAGSLTLQYLVEPNPSRSARVGNVSVISGDVTKTLEITQEAQVDFNIILGTANLGWNTGGDAFWFEQTNVVKTGDSALQSGGITHNQQTWTEATVQGPAVLSFWWKVSSEAENDVLTCAVNNTNALSIAGTEFGDWKQEILYLECETNTIRWTYAKNGSISAGSDAGWLDDLQCLPARSIRVLFDPQLGTLESTNEISFIIGMQYGILPSPTRAGYLFDGWYTEAGSGGTRIEASSIVLESIQTLYARWWLPTAGDIIGFYSPSANSEFMAPGATVEFTIRLYGTIVISNLNHTATYLPEIRMEVGSDGSSSTAYATLIRSAFTSFPFDAFNRTDLTFAYTIRPGDMADPLKIFRTSTAVFTIVPNQWWIYKAYPGNISSNVTWKVDNNLYEQPGNNGLDIGVIVQGDVDLSAQNIRLRTLSFDEANSPATIVARQPSTLWRITSGAMNTVPTTVMIWTPQTNVLQIGSIPGEALEVTIPAGTDHADFAIMGLDTNAIPTIATVYAQRPSDYAQNGTVIANFIERPVTITSSTTVSFDPLGGNVTPDSKEVVFGLAYGELPVPTFAGYTFDGWYTTPNSGGVRITSDSIVSEPDHTLFARWATDHYPIVYENTKGLNNPNPASYTIEDSFAFVPLGETSGYTFASWSPTGIILGTTGSVSVTANWSVKTFAISYLNEMGALNTNPATYTTEDSFAFIPLPDLPGYAFNHWSVAGVTNGMTGDITVTANWDSRSFIVTFDPQGGSVVPASKAVQYQTAYAGLPTPTFEDAGFSGWWTEPNGKGTNINMSAVVTTASNHTLYAKWDINSIVGTTGLVWRTGDNAFWYPQGITKSHGPLAMQSGPISDNQTSWIETVATGPCILRFQWKVDSEEACDNLVFKIDSEVKSMISGKDQPWTTNEFTIPAGEHNLRWEYNKDESESVQSDCGWLDHVEFVRTYVFFDAQGGQVSPTNKCVLYGTPHGELPTATFANAIMDGWWTEPNGKGEHVTSNSLVQVYDNYTLYAKWDINSVLGTPGWVWSTDGTDGKFWFPEEAIRHVDEPLAMQAGGVSHNESTWIETTITNAGVLSFRWAISAEVNKDVMICTTNGGHFETLSSKTLNWSQESITVSNAPVTIRWTFSKDVNTDIGTNSAWIAAFVWTPSTLEGFAGWASSLGLSGSLTDIFSQDRNSDGVPNGFEYAFGTNLPLTELMLNIRFVNGRIVVDIPKQDETTLPFVSLELKGSTNLTDWTLQTVPALDTAGKPSNREWREASGNPDKAFFKLNVELK